MRDGNELLLVLAKYIQIWGSTELSLVNQVRTILKVIWANQKKKIVDNG